MKECVECRKKLGIIEGYRHPTMGNEYLLCSDCFDSVSLSVMKWGEVISRYAGFFHKETSTIEDIQKVGSYLTKFMKKMQNSVGNLSSYHDHNKSSWRRTETPSVFKSSNLEP